MKKFTEEKIIINLHLKFEWTLPYKIFTLIWLCTELLILLDKSRFYSEYYCYYYIWEIPFYDLDKYGKGLSVGNLLLGIIITIIIAVVPFFIRSVYNFILMQSNISLTDHQIYGALVKPFSKRRFSIPLEKINEIYILNEFADKLRSGKTLVINFDSQTTKFHYVHNADEFIKSVQKMR